MIGEVKDNASVYQQQSAGSKAKANKTDEKAATQGPSQASDSVELGSQRTASTTYTRTTRRLSAGELATIKSAREQIYENLRSLVEQMLAGQNKTAKKAGSRETSDLDAVSKAQQAISEDGDFGVKAVSDRIVQFAVAISGGDKTKYETLKGAIDKGFQQATHSLGGKLPGISQQTYNEVMRKLDEWKNSDDDKTNA